MRLISFGLAILVVAVVATLYAIEDPGYVMIARAPWTVEMPLTLFVPLVVAASALLFVLSYIALRLLRIPRDVARWRTRRQSREGRAGLQRGLTHLAEGSWHEAETALLAAQRHGDMPLLSYLGAAVAAQGQGNIEKRDEYLAQAHRVAPDDALAIGALQAQLQQLAGQHEQSLATLAGLHQEHPRHKHVMRLLAFAYRDLRDWPGLLEVLPALRTANAMPTDEIEALELRAHRELLTPALPPNSREVLARAWGAVPKTLRRDPPLVAAHARQLIRQNEMDQAEKELRTALESSWDEALVTLYGDLSGPAAGEYLETAEGWLAMHPADARLLLTLGKLAAHAQQWPKARQYLEQSLTQLPTVAASHELGRALEQLGEVGQALAAYRRGLDISLDPATAKGTRTRARDAR